MIPSIKGHLLPESVTDAAVLSTRKQLRWTCCYNCKQPFSNANTWTAAGWRETQISQFCEDCYDSLFKDAQDSGIDEL